MKPTENYDIAIIGGGMVGASLACLLANACQEWRIVVIEAFPLPVSNAAANDKPTHYQPSFDARSSAIAQGSVEIFQQLGLWQTLAQHATPIRQVHISDRGHFGGSVISAREQGLEAVGYVIENAWLGSVLLGRMQQLDNVTCLSPTKVTQLSPRREGVALQLKPNEITGNESALDENTLNKSDVVFCKLAVIADGGDSPLRKALGIDTDIVDYHQQAIIANVSFSKPHQHIAFERFTDQGPLALLPLGEGKDIYRSALVWTQPHEQAERIMALSDKAFLAELQERFGYRLGHFTQVGKRNAYPLELITAREQVRSHITIMGNAAHFLHPVAGQGFNLALRDCATLVDVLHHAKQQGAPLGKLNVLQEYQRLQKLDQAATIRFSDTITQLFSTARLPAAILRNLGFLGLELLPPAKSLLAQQSMGKATRQARI